MSTDKVKQGGFFSLLDLLVYALLAAVVIALFLVVFFTGNKQTAGIEITVEGECVYTYIFGEGGKTAEGKQSLVREAMQDDNVVVTLTFEEGGYNVIVIDEKNKEVYVRDANCSFKKDCTHMAAITSEGGFLICVPHALIVKAIGQEQDLKPSVG